MRRNFLPLAAGLFLLLLTAAAAAPPQGGDEGSLVIDTKESSRPLASGDTLHDIKALDGQVQAYIFRNRTRVWSPDFSYRFRPGGARTGWRPKLANPELERLIAKYARLYGVDHSLIRAVMRHESGFNSQAVSPKGAQGLMQLMPGTAALMGVRDPFDPEQNIAGGVGYLRHCLDRFQNNVSLAVAAYNAGPGAVARYCAIPPYSETQTFVQNVLDAYGAYPLTTAASPKAAPAKGGPKTKTAPGSRPPQRKAAPPPGRTKGPKIIEVLPKKKTQTQAAQ
jgi:hypothetical protein